MSTIVTRAGKGASLSWTEGDANFTNLNTDKYQAGDSPTFVTAAITTANVTTANITTANITTANITTANITTAAVTNIDAVDIDIVCPTNGTPITLTDGTGQANFNFSAGALYFGTNTAHDLFFKVNNASVARFDDSLGTLFLAPNASETDLDLANGQIKFPAVQVASSNANTLDDYEEGTYTPTVTSGTGSITSYNVYGRYTKIGRVVHVQTEIDITNAGTGGSTLNFTVPFTSAASPFGTLVGLEVNVTGAAVAGYFSASNVLGQVFLATGGSPVTTGRRYFISGTYFT
jgi:hypothetical protein